MDGLFDGCKVLLAPMAGVVACGALSLGSDLGS